MASTRSLLRLLKQLDAVSATSRGCPREDGGGRFVAPFGGICRSRYSRCSRCTACRRWCAAAGMFLDPAAQFRKVLSGHADHADGAEG